MEGISKSKSTVSAQGVDVPRTSSNASSSLLRRATSEVHHANASKAALLGALKFKGLMNVRLRARKAILDEVKQHHANKAARNDVFPSSSTKYGTIGQEDDFADGTVEDENDGFSESDEHTLRSDIEAVKDCILGNKVSVFLALIPFGALAHFLDWGDTAIFTLNFFAILPLAQLLGDFTEEVALYTNETIGGLLNATLGNATELIISIFAIKKGLLRVVQVSLLGSVLSNELLVTGCCFLFGGLYHKEQHFNAHIAAIDSSLLLMAVLGLSIPAAFSSTVSNECHVPCRVDSIIEISHITALLLFFLYGMLLVFQLKTHTHLMDPQSEEHHLKHQQQPGRPSDAGSEKKLNGIGNNLKGSASFYKSLQSNISSLSSTFSDVEEDPEEATMSLNAAIFMLTITTLLVAWCSELLVGSLEDVSVTWGLSEVFIGLILLPIIGNAAEHATAITVAIKGKMDLALGVALGSSVQIALCVVPALCLVGWMLHKPLTLDFHPFETIVLVVSVLVVTSTVRQGTSTWLEGIMLIISYFIIGLAYFFRKEPPQGEAFSPACVCGEPCCWE